MLALKKSEKLEIDGHSSSDFDGCMDLRRSTELRGSVIPMGYSFLHY